MIELNENVILIVGAKNAAIYDFNVNKIYSINEQALNIIKKAVLSRATNCTQLELDYLSSLKQSKLISDNFEPREFIPPVNNTIKLNYAWLELTEGCNLKCLHCYEGNEHRHSTDELSTEQWKRIILDLYENGCQRLQFTGGECCLRTDFIELLDYATLVGFKDITVFTNASLLNEKIIDKFEQYKIKVRVSLYGHKAAVHESITQMPGSFAKSIDNIKKMLSKEIAVTPAVVIMKQNQEHIEDIKHFILDLGLKYTGYDIIRNVYGGTQQMYTPTKQEVLESKDRNKPLFQISKTKFQIALNHNTCWYGKFAITPTGKIIPCIFERNIELGDLTKQSVSDVLNSNILKKYWNFDFSQIENCRDCEYRFACKDCRPLGLSCSNEMSSKNPRCLYNPYTGLWGKTN